MERLARSARRSSARGVLKNIVLLLGVLAICAFSFEGMVRLLLDDGMTYEIEMWKYARDVKLRDATPDLGHRHAPNRDAALMGVRIRTDGHGVRGPQIADAAAPGAARIAFVGDSTTLGWGVAEQQTFAHQVVAALQRQGRKVEGFNLGVGNHNTTQELALFRAVGARLAPDIVVLTYFINDAEPMPAYGSQSWLDLNSMGWVVLRYRLDSLIRQFGSRPDWKQYYRGLYDADAAGWKSTQQALAGFAQASRDLGAALLVFHLPELRELRPYPFADVTVKVAKAVEDQGVRFVDLLPTVRDLDPKSLWVTVPDPHPNGAANTAFSGAMTREILPLLDDLCRRAQRGC